MHARFLRLLRATALAMPLTSLTATVAQGQWSATGVAVAEYDTNETLLLLAGISFSPWGGPGIAPVFGVQAYRLSYKVGDDTREITSVRPSAGLRNNFNGGSAQLRIGYAFTSDDISEPIAGGVGDRRDGVVLSGQVDWWGTGGPLGAQVIGSYNFGADALWARGRITTRVARYGERGQFRVGGEVAVLEDDDFSMVQPGAVFEWHTGGGTIVGFGVGVKLNDPGEDATYFKTEIVFPILR